MLTGLTTVVLLFCVVLYISKGSLLVACAHHGAYVAGSDIDYNLLLAVGWCQVYRLHIEDRFQVVLKLQLTPNVVSHTYFHSNCCHGNHRNCVSLRFLVIVGPGHDLKLPALSDLSTASRH